MNKANAFKSAYRSLQLFLLLSFLSPHQAHAYLDPGAASVIVTSILGAIAAISYTFRSYLAQVKDFFNRKKATEKPHQNDE